MRQPPFQHLSAEIVRVAQVGEADHVAASLRVFDQNHRWYHLKQVWRYLEPAGETQGQAFFGKLFSLNQKFYSYKNQLKAKAQ